MKTSHTHSPRTRFVGPLFALLSTLLLSTAGSLFAHGDHGPKPPRCTPLHPQTVLQLEYARQAAAKFFDVQAAEDAGYEDIELDVPHMGLHYVHFGLLEDGRFEPTRPEILVYQKDCDGKLRLAAVEYAVPTDNTPRPPRGFAGHDDVWFNDTTFKLWTLHAWVYDFNPDGVFASHNPRLP